MSSKPEKSDKKAEAPAAAGGEEKAAKKGGLLSKTPVLLAGVMVLEAVVLFAGFKFLGGSPKPAAAVDVSHDEGGDEKKGEPGHEEGDKSHAEPAKGEGHGEAGKGEEGKGEGGEAGKGPAVDPRKLVEVKILDYKAINRRDGRATLYDVAVSVTTRGKFKSRIEAMVSERDGLIKDRVRTIIAQSDPEKLGGGSEPGLETFRRQVKYQLDEIVGEGLIDEVLVPRCIPYRAD